MGGSSEKRLWGEPRVPTWILALALLGAPVAWSLHLLVSYFLVALGCNLGWEGGVFDLVLILVTLAFVALCILPGVVAYRVWRRMRGEHGWLSALEEPGDQSRFFLLMGIAGSVLFAIITLLAGLPPLFVPTCTA